MLWLGDVNAGSTVRIPFNTNAVAGESIVMATDFTIAIYKDGSTTERTSANGVTLTESHDGHVGTNLVTIDLSDNTDSGFYAAGSQYIVKGHTGTIDGKSVSVWLGTFTIDKTYQYADARKLAGVTQSLTDLKDFADDGYDPSTNKVQGVVLVDTATLVNGLAADSITAAALATSFTAELFGTALTESYSTDGAAFTAAQALYEICQGISEFAIAGTTKTVKKRDGSTTAYTETLDSATAPTSITRAT